MKKVIVLLFLVSLLYRFYFLWANPPAVTHDEADLYYSSYTLSHTGHDEYGNKLFFTSGFLTAKPNIPIYLGAVFWKLFPEKNVLNARLPFAILNSLIPVLFYIVLWKLSKNQLLSLLGFLTFTFSPWFSYLSVTGYEGFIALLFLFAALITLISTVSERIKLLVFFFFNFLAFNSYMGIRIIFPFVLMIFLLIYFAQTNNIKIKTVAISVIFSILLTLLLFSTAYLFPNTSLLKNDASNSIIFLNKPRIENSVWYNRLTSTGPLLITKIFQNKFSAIADEMGNKYAQSFNITSIFKTGDSSVYGIANQGLFYATDFLFFLLGLFNLYKFKNTSLKILLSLFFIAGIPIAVSTNTPTIIFRGLLLIIPYILLIIWGMYSFLALVKRRKYAIGVIILLLSINILYFSIVYPIHYAVVNADFWHSTEKNMIDKVVKLPKNKMIVVYNPEPKPTFLLYSFYYGKDTAKLASNNVNGIYGNNKLLFKNECPRKITSLNEIYIYRKNDCKSKQQSSTFVEAVDKTGNDYLITKNVE